MKTNNLWLDDKIHQANLNAEDKLKDLTNKINNQELPDSTGFEASVEQIINHKKASNKIIKAELEKILKDDLIELQKMIDSPAWAIYKELVESQQDAMNYQSTVEYYAFTKHRELVTNELLNLPGEVLHVIKGM